MKEFFLRIFGRCKCSPVLTGDIMLDLWCDQWMIISPDCPRHKKTKGGKWPGSVSTPQSVSASGSSTV